MLIKKIGHTVIIRTKLYAAIPYIGPLLMIASILLVAVVPNITETYQFQQPILRTKIMTVQPMPSNFSIQYEQAYPGVMTAVIDGRLTAQSILLVSACGQRMSSRVLDIVYYNIASNNKEKKRKLAKNVGFVCYQSAEQLNKYIQLLQRVQKRQLTQTFPIYDKQEQPQYIPNEIGIIRNALMLAMSPEKQGASAKSTPKVYFNPYSVQSELKVDVDYYQAIKELLHSTGLTKWQPCRAIDDHKLLNRLARLSGRYWWSSFFKNTLCQLYQVTSRHTHIQMSHLSYIPSILHPQQHSLRNLNHIFLQSGIQAATLDISCPANNQTQMTDKLAKILLSFVEQFVVIEDHLHSSSTIYTPLNQFKYVPIKGLIIPGIVFLVIAAAYLITKLVYVANSVEIGQQSQGTKQKYVFMGNSLNISLVNKPSKTVCLLLSCIYFSTIQYYFAYSVFYSVTAHGLARLLVRQTLPQKQREVVRILLAGFNILLCQYFAIFCFPLSLISIITTNVICFCNKTVCLFIIATVFATFCYFSEAGLLDNAVSVYNTSFLLQTAIYPLILWVFVV